MVQEPSTGNYRIGALVKAVAFLSLDIRKGKYLGPYKENLRKCVFLMILAQDNKREEQFTRDLRQSLSARGTVPEILYFG